MTDAPEPTYRVVVNDEEQYSIWPVDRELPSGWRPDGTIGPKEVCLAHIDEVWTDMRPLSLRRQMEATEAAADVPAPPPPPPEEPLVERLARGSHRVEVSLRPSATTAALRDALDRGYVFLTFTDTRGGTELGVTVDRGATDTSAADLDAGSGRIHVEGELALDFVPVRCVADIDVASLTGEGHLEIREQPT
jgi:uncharacterized protein YbdZ (MbtH family)